MILEEALYHRLANFSGLASLVSTRIYPMRLPPAAVFPAVTYQRVSGVRVQSLGGPTGLAAPRFQISVWASSYSSAKAVATQVRLALDGFQGNMGASPYINVSGITLENDLEMIDPDTQLFHIPSDFTIWHQEATA